MVKSLLIIDDDLNFIDLYSQILENDFNVKSVTNLKDALKIIDNDPFYFDLILCDIFMPEINGFEVFDFFKSSPEYEHLNIIFKTSSLNKDVIEDSLLNKKVELISTYMSNAEVIARINSATLKGATLRLSNCGRDYLIINTKTKKTIYPHYDIPFEFTDKEIKILATLSNQSNPISKEEVLKTVFTTERVITDNNFNTTITNLRKKVLPSGIKIIAKRNHGLKLCFLD